MSRRASTKLYLILQTALAHFPRNPPGPGDTIVSWIVPARVWAFMPLGTVWARPFANSKVSPKIVQQILRHTDIKTMLRDYIHCDTDRVLTQFRHAEWDSASCTNSAFSGQVGIKSQPSFPRVYISNEVHYEVVIAGAGLPGASEVSKAEWIEVTSIQNPAGLHFGAAKIWLRSGRNEHNTSGERVRREHPL